MSFVCRVDCTSVSYRTSIPISNLMINVTGAILVDTHARRFAEPCVLLYLPLPDAASGDSSARLHRNVPERRHTICPLVFMMAGGWVSIYLLAASR